MLLTIARNLEKALLQRISERYQVRYDSLNFTVPPRIELGELALPVAFDLARKVRRPPAEIAGELAADAGNLPGIGKVDVAGGYLNFHLDRGSLARALARSIEQKRYGCAADPEPGGKVIVEHTNINPNKAAHNGHLRNAALGDSFVRCLRFLGRHVEVQNYLDNTGVQVADVVVGLERMQNRTLAEVAAIEGKFDYFCWDVYAQVSDFYQRSEENKKWRSRTLQSVEAGGNPTAEMAQHVAMRVVRAHLATMARINVRYDLLPRESEILHLHFWDTAFRLLKERGAVYYVEEGKNHGCWVMNTGEAEEEVARAEAEGPPQQKQGRCSQEASRAEAEGPPQQKQGRGGQEASRAEAEDDEKIIVRSDGTVTYVGKDIAYQLWKFGLLGLDFHYRRYDLETGHPGGPGHPAGPGHPLWITATEGDGAAAPRFGHAERVYNVIDSRQAYLQSIVVQGLRALGYHAQAENSIHFSYEMVALTPTCCDELGFPLSESDRKRPYVEVSGRKGLGVKADDLLDALEDKALGEVQARHTLPEEESRRIARAIAVGALRYFLLRFSRNTVIAFDLREALSFDGETGPYVQYAAVRAGNIFRKLEESGEAAPPLAGDHPGLDAFLEGDDEIWDIVCQAARFPEVVRQISQNLELGQLCKFAFSLAQKFNLFYHKHHILSETDPQRKRHLLLVVDLVRRQLEKALDLLGCEVPSRM